MPTELTGGLTLPATITVPVGGDPRTAASVQAGFQDCADGLNVLSLRAYGISVMEHGALGNAVADDSAAIQAAIDAAAAASVPVIVPPGIYLCNNLSRPPQVSIIGHPTQSVLSCNHATNPVMSGTFDDGTATSIWLSSVIYGIHFSFSTANSVGNLLTIGGHTRTLLEACRINQASSGASAKVGAINLGSSGDVTDLYICNCAFNIVGEIYEQGVSRVDGTTNVWLSQCKVRPTASARQQSFAFFEGSNVRMTDCLVDLSAATSAGGTSMRIMQSPAGSLFAGGCTFTAPAGGTAQVFHAASGVDVREAPNIYGAGVEIMVPTTVQSSAVASRADRMSEVTQSGGGTLTLQTHNYGCFFVSLADALAFNLSAAAGTPGQQFDLIMHNPTGSSSGTITYVTSAFGGFSSVSGAGEGPAVSVSTGRFASCRFRWSNGPDGYRWYPVGSAIQAS